MVRWPTVTCVCITGGRPNLLRLAIENFRAQDYPEKRLIVVEDGQPKTGRENRDGYLWIGLPGIVSMGAKRTIGIQEVKGSVVAMWDDDDWSAPNRLSLQAEVLFSTASNFVFLVRHRTVFFPEETWRVIKGPVTGNLPIYSDCTLVCYREMYEKYGYPESLNRIENVRFLMKAQKAGETFGRVNGEGLYVYVRHAKVISPVPADDAEVYEKSSRPRWFYDSLFERYREAVRSDMELREAS